MLAHHAVMLAHHEAIVVAQGVSAIGLSGLSLRCLWKLALLRFSGE